MKLSLVIMSVNEMKAEEKWKQKIEEEITRQREEYRRGDVDRLWLNPGLGLKTFSVWQVLNS